MMLSTCHYLLQVLSISFLFLSTCTNLESERLFLDDVVIIYCFSILSQVSRLQEQLQAERDLRAALEVGLSMSSGQFSSSRSMDSKVSYLFSIFYFTEYAYYFSVYENLLLYFNWKTRAELEEIALAEADVARLKKKVAELHLQLNQQRQHQCSFVADDSDHYQNFPTHLSQP